MSKTGAWIMDLEEQFWDKCVDFIKNNEDVSLAQAEAIKYAKDNLSHIEEDIIEDTVSEMWADYWVNYQ